MLTKLAPILSVNLTIGKRLGIQRKARFLTPSLYFLMAFTPLIIGITQDTNFGQGSLIVAFSSYNFVVAGLLRGIGKKNIQLHQIRIYPLPDRSIFRLLWVIELLDYTLLMLIVSAIGVILMLYPDFFMITLCLVCLGLGYALMTLLVSEAKLLISFFPPSIYVIVLGIAALNIACFWLWAFVTKGDPNIYEFVSNWGLRVFVFWTFLLISLYKIGIFFVSKIFK